MPNLPSHYDQAGDFYFHFIKKGLAQPQSMFHLAVNAVLELLSDVVEPRLPPGDYTELSHQVNSHVPQVLVVAAIKEV